MVKDLILYSDNIMEGIQTLNSLKEKNEYLVFDYFKLDRYGQPFYSFKIKSGQLKGDKLEIYVKGKYENWSLPKKIRKIQKMFDKPDFILADAKNPEKIIMVGENTGTTNLGNSQWQREARKLAAALEKVPFLYYTYYAGADRSGRKEQIREPTVLQVFNHLLFCIRYKTPSFVLYKTSQYDKKKNIERIRKGLPELKRTKIGEELYRDYISISILNYFSNFYLNKKREIEISILYHMIDYILEYKTKKKIKKNESKSFFITRLENDFPKCNLELFFDIEQRKKLIGSIVDRMNNLNQEFNFSLKASNFEEWFEWKPSTNSFKGYINKFGELVEPTKLYQLVKEKGISFKSYIPRVSVPGFTKERDKFNKILKKEFGLKEDLKGKWTCLIPVIGFQKKADGRYIVKKDPYTGEVVAFVELFCKNETKDETKTNIVVYFCVEGPTSIMKFNNEFFNLMKYLIKKYGAKIIVNDKVYNERKN